MDCPGLDIIAIQPGRGEGNSAYEGGTDARRLA